VNPFLSNSPQSATKRSKLICGLAVFIFILHLTYTFVNYLYVETYIWQSLTFGEFIRPIHRKQCLVSYAHDPDHKTFTLFQVAHSNGAPPTSLASPQQNISSTIASRNNGNSNGSPKKPLKIGMVMLYQKDGANWNQDLMIRVLHNREKYCAQHGCSIINANHLLDHSRPAAWSKLKAVDHYLHQYDYIFYIDMDVVIMDFDIPLTAFIDLAPNHDFIMTEDWNGINSGNWIVRNSPFSHWFLQTAWNQTQLIPKKSADGIAHPFEYEQRAFHFLLNTEIWRKRRLPTYRGDSKELLSHFYLLPQCAMNSYVLGVVNRVGNREKSHFVEGDFLVHFAGKKHKIKNDLIDYFLDKAES
jgi:hypothetical protein